MAEIDTLPFAARFLDESRRCLIADHFFRIERAVALLSDEQIWFRSNEASNSIGNLLLHLAGNLRQWIVSGIGEAPNTRDRAREFSERTPRTRAEVLEVLRSALNDTDAVLASLPISRLDERRHIYDGEATLGEVIYQIVQHFAMHAGQIILLAKAFVGDRLNFDDLSNVEMRRAWRERTTATPGGAV